MPSKITFSRHCVFCGKEHIFTVDAEKYHRWRGGEKIQFVWPNLSDERRETMISGSCPNCFDKAFKEK